MEVEERYIAFEGMSRLVEGTLAEVSKVVSDRLKTCPNAPILIFERSHRSASRFRSKDWIASIEDAAPKAPPDPVVRS